MNYYISDLHLGHANVLEHDQRPFCNVDEMQQVIVNNWNAVVNEDDTVYIVGDFAWKPIYAVAALNKLKGVKVLIHGNHDKPNQEVMMHFAKVTEVEYLDDAGAQVVLCHYPMANWKNMFHGSIHLYGHVHYNKDARIFETYKDTCIKAGIPCNAFNVGCMMPYMNYTPKTLSEIITGYHAWKEQISTEENI